MPESKSDFPDKIFGIDAKEAYKRVVKSLGEKVEEEPKISFSVNGVPSSDYIWLPKHKLYVAKRITPTKKKFIGAHKELQDKNARMLTLREFADFLLHLRDSYEVEDGLGERLTREQAIVTYKSIVLPDKHNRSEKLDALFTEYNGVKVINYAHRFVSKKLLAQKSEVLQDFLNDMKKVDLASFNNQGLPTREGNDFWFTPPIEKDSTAHFLVEPKNSWLNCRFDKLISGSDIGVRFAYEKKLFGGTK